MAKNPTTRGLSDKHEEFLAKLFGARQTPGSGNQFNNPLDVRMSRGRHTPIAFGFEAKSTRSASLSIGLSTWDKLCEQVHDLKPAMALRFYGSDNLLTPLRDLIVVEANDFAAVLEAANIYEEMGDR